MTMDYYCKKKSLLNEVPSSALSGSSVQVSKCLKSPRVQVFFKRLDASSAKVLFKCPSSALQVPRCPMLSSGFEVPNGLSNSSALIGQVS